MKNSMEKFLSVFLVIFISVSLFIGCESSKKAECINESFQSENLSKGNETTDIEKSDKALEDNDRKENILEGNKFINSSSKKIIKNVDITLQTTEFEKSIDEINNEINKFKGFIQSSYINGNGIDNNGNTYNRNGNITARIPSKDLDKYLAKLKTIAHVSQEGQHGEDVTLTYADNEARLKVFKTKEARLLELLKESKNVSDVIAVESELYKVRYDIESLEGQLKNLDNLIEYSTVYINIEEVEKINKEIDMNGSMHEKIINSFINSMKNLGHLMKNSIIYFVAAIPYIVVIIIIVFLIKLIIKKFNIKNRFINKK